MMTGQMSSTAVPIRDKYFYQQVARLHISGISQGFLPQLGVDFMTLLYEAIDECPSSMLLTHCVEGKVVGFVSGADSMRPIYRQLMYKPLHVFVSLLPSLVRPHRLRRIFEIMHYGRQSHSDKEATMPAFELLSIVVDPVARGTGCADRLYQDLITYCRSNGIKDFKIVVGNALSPAHSFYKRMGAEPVGRVEVHAGEGSVVYVQRVLSNQEDKND